MDTSNIFDDLMNFEGDIDFNKHINKSNQQPPEGKKKLKPSEKLLQDIEGYGFDLTQMKPILTTRGNQLVVSCAGSGKTTALVFKIIYDIKSGYATVVKEVNGNPIRVVDKIWVSTFLNSGAEELAFSLRNWQNKLHCNDTSQSIQFSTLHAEFKRALNQMGITTNIVSSKDNSAYLKKVVGSYHLTNDKGLPLNSEDYRNLESALSYTRNRLDNKRYVNDVYDDLNIGYTLIDSILKEWKAMRKQHGVCDFEDLQEMLYEQCYEKNNQDVINFLAKRYNFIYVDEFQDTSQIQYKLLQVYAINCKQFMVIGDDDQTIYSWRGSDNNIITKDFMKDFSPTKNELSVNFRCPSNILNAIKPSIMNNENRFDKPLSSFNEGGKVRYVASSNYTNMVSTLSDLVLEDVKNNRSVAILCRVNSDGLMPALILDKLNNFTFSISGEGMTLDSYIGRTVLAIVKLFTEKSTADVKRALNLLTWEGYQINNLMKVCKSNKLSIWNIDEKDLSYSCPELSETILKWRSWKQSMGEVKTLKLVLQNYRVNVFQKDTQFNNVMRSVLSAVEALLDYFNYDNVQDFEYELEDINERLKARMKKKSVKVKIATIHEFKGKEADSVYIWNDSMDVFPIKDAETEDEIEEERRVHYIACTRAKQISTLVFLNNHQGMFVNEMDLSNAEEVSTGGVVSGIIQRNAEEEANLKEFQRRSDDEYLESLRKKEGYSQPDTALFGGENEDWGNCNEFLLDSDY